jgi:hypothetical protein
MSRLRLSVLVIGIAVAFWNCSSKAQEPVNGYSEREIGGKTWYFPTFSHWTTLDMMPIEEYQSLVNGSHLIDMAPVYGYTTERNGCKTGIVVSAVSKYSNTPQSEYDFVKKSPAEVNELIVPSENDESTKVLFSIFSVKFQRKTTRVVLVHFKSSILSFELRRLSGCSDVTDEELIEFVQKFIMLNV